MHEVQFDLGNYSFQPLFMYMFECGICSCEILVATFKGLFIFFYQSRCTIIECWSCTCNGCH